MKTFVWFRLDALICCSAGLYYRDYFDRTQTKDEDCGRHFCLLALDIVAQDVLAFRWDDGQI